MASGRAGLAVTSSRMRAWRLLVKPVVRLQRQAFTCVDSEDGEHADHSACRDHDVRKMKGDSWWLSDHARRQ